MHSKIKQLIYLFIQPSLLLQWFSKLSLKSVDAQVFPWSLCNLYYLQIATITWVERVDDAKNNNSKTKIPVCDIVIVLMTCASHIDLVVVSRSCV